MKYGIISDIHSNIDALNLVLEDLEKKNVDKILCLGDVIGIGLNPDECIKKINSLGKNVLLYMEIMKDTIYMEFQNLFTTIKEK